ncbi:alpha-amylase family glycosyl hydrolase [Fervidobacterium islandicum]|uniref:alpha-amylase family glycosyl hydrolase n=1 Tax=Fervidobacterium islandicum TaxID=2423 RepID=UPI003A6BDB73
MGEKLVRQLEQRRFTFSFASVLALLSVAFSVVFSVLGFSDVLSQYKGGWADKVLYMIMIDRFNDGEPSNNNQGKGEYDPRDGAKYSGGDLKGIIDKIDYIKGLGVDGIWITPPVANQWWDPWVSYGGYHGYWARDFKKVDEHFGTLEDYKALAEKLHENGMKLIQDIVVNHVGNYFRFRNNVFELNTGSIPTSAPTQYPFNLNNYNDPSQRERAIYHWTPDITNYSDPYQKLYYQMSGLDDLNTENPEVVEALKDSYAYWIKEIGVDGFRVDTAMYVQKSFFDEFFKGNNGMFSLKPDFIAFGETWLSSKPYENTSDLEIASYFEHGFNSMLDFTLMEDIRRVIKGGQPTDFLAYRLTTRNEILKRGLLVTFIDNHDMERFGKGVTPNITMQALGLLLTLPGMPVIYYGTEQYFEETRASMFNGGWGSFGKSHFNPDSDMYKFIKNAIEFRKSHPATRYGEVEILLSEKRGSGLLIYTLKCEEEELMVVLNTANDSRITNFKTKYEPGTTLEPIYNAVGGFGTPVVVRTDGYITLRVPPRTFTVFGISQEKSEVYTPTTTVGIDLKDGDTIKALREVVGTTTGKTVYVYIDRKAENEIKIEPKEGKFTFTIDPFKLDPGEHVLLVRAVGRNVRDTVYTSEIRFAVELEKRLLAEAKDPLGDDIGPNGTYVYPTDATFKRQMDIVEAKVESIGSTLVISIKPRDLTKSWGPPNGFDHVTYQIFIDDPNRKGTGVLPLQNYEFDNWDWDWEVFATGWSSAIYTSQSATKDKFGTQIGSPEVFVEDEWVKIIIKGEWLGNPSSFAGWTIYITSWDYDGIENKFRPLQQEPKAYIMGGGNPTDPLIMDDVWLEIEGE